MSEISAHRALALCCFGILVLIRQPAAAAGAVSSAEPSFPTVRADLEAGTFLDPLPFDRSFLLAGWVRAGTEVVEVRLTEYLREPVLFSETELQRIEVKLTAYLERAAAQGSPEAPAQTPTVDMLRRDLAHMLADEAEAGGLLRPLRWVWHYLPPWNWDNWSHVFRTRKVRVAAPGTILDADAAGTADELEAALASVRAGSVQAASDLAAALAGELGAAQALVCFPADTPPRSAHWRRLGTADGTTGQDAEPYAGWNRLELARSLTRVRVSEEKLSTMQAPQRGWARGDGWRMITLRIPALKAEHYYGFDFRLERKPTDAEVRTFIGRARREAPRSLMGAPGGAARAAGRAHLRRTLAGILSGAVDRHWHAAPGSLLDPDAPSSALGQMGRLAADLTSAAGEDEETAPAERGLEDLVRQQNLAYQTRVAASTAGSNYVSADVGLLHAGVIGETVPYVGVNLYLRPVDKSISLRQHGGPLRRFSVTAGLTLTSIADRRGIRNDLFFNQAAVLGAGYRISQDWRIGGGTLVFRERDPATFPLTRRRSTAVTPYVSVSLDADVGRQLRSIGGLFSSFKGSR